MLTPLLKLLTRLVGLSPVILSSALHAADLDLPSFESLPAPDPAPVAPGVEFAPPMRAEITVNTSAPSLFESTADAGSDQSFFVTGERLGRQVFAWGRGAGASGGESSKVRILAGSSEWLTAHLDITAYGGPFLVWAHNDAGWSRPIRLNIPQAWWHWPAEPAPGQVVRLFGRDLARRPDRATAHVWLAEPGKNGRWLEIATAGKYQVSMKLPDDLRPGRYLIWVHAGHGGRYGWGEALPMNVKAAPEIRKARRNLSPTSDPARPVDLNEALARLAQDGGGTLRLGPGVFSMRETLRIPAHTTLQGAGKALTQIRCEPSGKDGFQRAPLIPSSRPVVQGKTPPPSIPTAAVWLSGHGSAITDLAVLGNPEISNGIIAAAPDPLAWLDHCRIERCLVADLEGVDQEISAVHLFRSRNAIVSQNELHGRVLVDLSAVTHSLITSNILVPVLRYGARFKETAEGAIQSRNEVLEGCIIEHNVTRAPQGAEAGGAQTRRLIWVATGRGSVTHNWLGHNATSEQDSSGRAVDGPQMAFGAAAGYENQNVGEVILFEANHRTMYFGAIVDASKQDITLPASVPPTPDARLGTVSRQELEADGGGEGKLFLPPDRDDGSPEPAIREYCVTILQGPGQGQTRRVVAREGRTLKLDRPWQVPPRSGSLASVSTGFFRNHIVGNTVTDGMTGIQLWIGCNENIISANTVRRMRSPGLFLHSCASTLASSMPRTWNSGLGTCYFNTVEGNWVEMSNLGLFVNAHEEPKFPTGFPLTLGTLLRHNTLLNSRSTALAISGGAGGTAEAPNSPVVVGLVAEQNVARDMQTGYASSAGSDGVVFRRNHAYFWHGSAQQTGATAFRLGRPRASAWVDENTVEGHGAGPAPGIRVLEKAGEK